MDTKLPADFRARATHARPDVATEFSWSTPFHEGVLGALFKPEKSIFLFDPLFLLAMVLIVLLWSRMSAEIRAYAVASLVLVARYISFYARYTYWAGDFSWGDRYVSTPVQMVALLSIPLLMNFVEISERGCGASEWLWLPSASWCRSLRSMFWVPIEYLPDRDIRTSTFVIALRLKNIAAFALGKMEEWGLNTEAMGQDPWDYVHITCWNFLPFLLRRVGPRRGGSWIWRLLIWTAALAALAGVLWRLRLTLRLGRFAEPV